MAINLYIALILNKVVNKDLYQMKKTGGLTPNQERLLSILEYKKYKTIKRADLISLILKYEISKNPKYLIKSMLQKKRVIPFKRGNYLVIPMSSVNKSVEITEFELNEYLLESKDYYIGLYNALNLYGFTNQIPNKIFIFNTKYSFDKQILHYKFKYFKIRKNKLFGILKKYKYPYSDRERTIIDVLDYDGYLGGLGNVMDIIMMSKYNKKRLIDYSIKYDSIKIMKIIGLITNSSKLFNLLKKNGALSYYTNINKTGDKLINKKWKIRMI